MLAPVLGGVALLGEAGKVAAVSTYRFASVAAASGGGVAISLRGAPSEVVTLLFADAASLACASLDVTIGDDGTATAQYP